MCDDCWLSFRLQGIHHHCIRKFLPALTLQGDWRCASNRRRTMTSRNGSAEWTGDLKSGSGTITVGNGVFHGPYTYDSRFGEQGGTNPEQLIAAAQAGGFTMALASLLSKAGPPPGPPPPHAPVEVPIVGAAPTLH